MSHAGAAERRVGDLQAAAVGAGDVGRHGETEASAAGVAGPSLVESHEAAHDVGALARRDAGPVVVDVHAHVAVDSLDRDPDRCGRRGARRWPRGGRPLGGRAARRRRPGGTPSDRRRRRPAPAAAATPHRAPRRRGRRRRRRSDRRTLLVGAGEQQQVVDQALQPIELERAAPSAVACQSGSGDRRATSSSARITATGVRSSCEASDTSRRLDVVADSSRPSIPFIVRASSAISSADAGSGTRSCSEWEVIAATRDVTACTGRRARPASSHASPATSATRAGPIDPQQLPCRGQRVAHGVERRRRGEHHAADRQGADRELGGVALDAEQLGPRRRHELPSS